MQHLISEHRRRLNEFIGQFESFNGDQAPIPLSRQEQLFNRLALDLFALQFGHVPVYRQFCVSRGAVAGSIETWREIPALPVSAFKDFEITSIPPQERSAVFYSSGTTRSSRSQHFHSAESLAIYEASLLPWFQRHLLPEARDSKSPRLKFLSLTPAPASVPASSLVHMFGCVASRFASDGPAFVGQACEDGWVVDTSAAIEFLERAQADPSPTLLLGSAFSFVQFLESLISEGLQFTLPPASRIMETGGYKGRSREMPKTELHQLMHRCLGVPPTHIVSEYGMSELSSQAYDRQVPQTTGANHTRAHRRFRFPPWVRTQIISPETGREAHPGQAGLIRIFDLANVSSIMAIQTEDLGIAHDEGFDLLGRAAAAPVRGCSLMSITA